MPSPQTNPKKLDRQIRELEEKDQLSEANQKHMRFMQLWRQFAGQDVYLWVRPRGKINRSETPPGRVRAVTDKVAAHELVYAEAGSVRLATDEEIAAFRAESDERRTRLQRETAEQTTRLAQAQLEAILGQFLPRGLSVQEVQPGAAAAPIDLANLSLEEIEALLLKVREAKGGGAPPAEDAPVADASLAAGEAQTEGPPARPQPLLSDLGSEALVRSLAEAGFGTVEQVASARPEELAERVKGVGPARAAELVTRAAELLAAAAATEPSQADATA